MKKTVVLGATPNADRYANMAVHRLIHYGFTAVPVGIRKGEIAGIPILNDKPEIEDVDTITLYLNPETQKEYYPYILSLHPKRIIFNPGTENRELAALAKAEGVETIYACTLVMLNTGQY